MTAGIDEHPPAARAENATYDNVACPFCGLLCDDLKVSRSGQALKVEAGGCPKGTYGFQRDLPAAFPQVDGVDTDLQSAIRNAADIIKGSRQPLFGGLATDVDGVRGALALAEKSRGTLDHALSESSFRNYRVLQTRGWFMSTLTEVRNRSDLIIVVGSDIQKKHSRFFERIVCAEESMFAKEAPKRDVVFLGEGLDDSAVTGPRIGSVTHLPCPLDQVGSVVGALYAAISGGRIGADVAQGVAAADVQALAERVKGASYPVFTWVTSSLAYENADLTVHRVCELVRELNKTQRAAGLSLGGDEGSQTAGYTAGWQVGYPLRVSFASGAPMYDPERFSAAHMLANGQADLLVWTASFSRTLGPPATKIPQIVIGTPGLEMSAQPKVFIPVGTPGVDHAGRLVRCDGSVTLPLKNLGRRDLPSTADVLTAITAAL